MHFINLELKNYMNASNNDSAEPVPATVREEPGPFGFDLPVDPGYRERPPQGSWEDGLRLSEAALDLVENRPEIFSRRDASRCTVEFVL